MSDCPRTMLCSSSLDAIALSVLLVFRGMSLVLELWRLDPVLCWDTHVCSGCLVSPCPDPVLSSLKPVLVFLLGLLSSRWSSHSGLNINKDVVLSLTAVGLLLFHLYLSGLVLLHGLKKGTTRITATFQRFSWFLSSPEGTVFAEDDEPDSRYWSTCTLFLCHRGLVSSCGTPLQPSEADLRADVVVQFSLFAFYTKIVSWCTSRCSGLPRPRLHTPIGCEEANKECKYFTLFLHFLQNANLVRPSSCFHLATTAPARVGRFPHVPAAVASSVSTRMMCPSFISPLSSVPHHDGGEPGLLGRCPHCVWGGD